MSTKMIFIFRLFCVIILFANFALCIQNGGSNGETETSTRTQNMIQFSADDAIVGFPQATNEHQKSFETKQPYSVDQDKFNFHTNQHHPTQQTAETPKQPTTQNHERGKYSQYSTASRQGGSSLNSIYNTGEHYSYPSSNYNHRHPPPPSNFNRPYRGQYTLNEYDRDNIAANYHQSYQDKPNYFQNNYAHNYNYPGNKRLNYNQRATPPPPPDDYPYEQQYYQQAAAARPTPPYPYPYPGQQQHSPNNYPSYAGLFNNFQAFPNPLTSLFGGMFGSSNRPANPLGFKLSKALEDIAANDDLNCVPKLLCQMAGNPERRAELPSFLTAPAITSLIAALPAASPVLVFGRAALLGFTGGEESCTSTFDKCPGNEDDLLYYLNNHRGGFFRFFNGGGSFNEVSSNFDDSSSQYTGTRPQSSNYGQNQGSTSSSGGGGGLNLLGTLASFFMPNVQSSNSGSDGLVSMVGNLLGGLVPSKRSISRKLQKRSVDSGEIIDDIDVSNTTEKANVTDENLDREVEKKEDENDGKVEGRILNHKSGILSESNNSDPPVKFPFDDQSNYADNYRYGKGFNFRDYKNENLATYVKYPTNNNDNYDNDDRPYRDGKQISFKDDERPNSDNYYPQKDDNRYHDYQNDRPYKTKMIFPDRTGTGNLRFDSAELERDADRDYNNRYPDRNRDQNYNRYRDDRDRYVDRNRDYNRDRYRDDDDRDYNRNRDTHRDGKILTRPSYSKYDKYYDYDEFYSTKRKPYYSSDSHHNDYHNSNRYDTTTRRPYYSRYETTTTRRPYYSRYDTTTTRRPYYSRYETTRRPTYNDDYYGNRYTNKYTSSGSSSGGEGNTYITNANGVVEYYIKPNGQKVYV